MNIKDIYPKSLEDFISNTLSYQNEGLIRLYRGQEHNWFPAPKVLRIANDRKVNPLKLETKIFDNFKNQALIFHKDVIHYSPLEKLTLAQHFGLPTRLLDWTTNPLIAIWFACQGNQSIANQDRVVWGYGIYEEEVSKINPKNPFSSNLIRFFKPNNIDQRISAQDSWFSIHPIQVVNGVLDKQRGDGLPHFNKIETFENNSNFYFAKFHINEDLVGEILEKLNLIGINYRTLFPSLEGLCNQIEWESNSYDFEEWN